MHLPRVSAAVTLALLLGSTSTADDGWTDDLDQAKSRAATEGKALLLDFTGSDWCHWCERLDGEVFQTELFQDEVGKRFVPVVLDFPRDPKLVSEEVRARNEELKQRYGVRGFPTVILADEQGRPFASTGYRDGGPEPYVKHLDELLELRKLRDLAFARADEVEGVARARRLDAALQTLDPAFVSPFYDPVIAEIVELDADDEAGLRSRYKLRLDQATADKVLTRVEEEVSRHAAESDWEGLVAAMDAILAEHGGSPEIAQRALFQRATAELELGRFEDGLASLKEARAKAPKGELVVVIDRVIRVVERRIK